MDGTRNIYGVKHMRLTVDGRQIYSRDIDRVAFGSTRAVHYIDPLPVTEMRRRMDNDHTRA